MDYAVTLEWFTKKRGKYVGSETACIPKKLIQHILPLEQEGDPCFGYCYNVDEARSLALQAFYQHRIHLKQYGYEVSRYGNYSCVDGEVMYDPDYFPPTVRYDPEYYWSLVEKIMGDKPLRTRLLKDWTGRFDHIIRVDLIRSGVTPGRDFYLSLLKDFEEGAGNEYLRQHARMLYASFRGMCASRLSIKDSAQLEVCAPTDDVYKRGTLTKYPHTLEWMVDGLYGYAHSSPLLLEDVPFIREFLHTSPGQEKEAYERWDAYWDQIDFEARLEYAPGVLLHPEPILPPHMIFSKRR